MNDTYAPLANLTKMLQHGSTESAGKAITESPNFQKATVALREKLGLVRQCLRSMKLISAEEMTEDGVRLFLKFETEPTNEQVRNLVQWSVKGCTKKYAYFCMARVFAHRPKWESDVGSLTIIFSDVLDKMKGYPAVVVALASDYFIGEYDEDTGKPKRWFPSICEWERNLEMESKRLMQKIEVINREGL